MALFSFGLLMVALWQLNKFNNQTRADFTYKVYRDLLGWLNSHKEVKNWIFKPKNIPLGSNFDEWEFDDFLGYFETVWSLNKKRLVDKNIIYDLLSDYLISVYEANDKELEEIINKIRKEEGKPDLYIGVEKLYKEMKKIEQKIKKPLI